jgi:hypothetical protein
MYPMQIHGSEGECPGSGRIEMLESQFETGQVWKRGSR